MIQSEKHPRVFYRNPKARFWADNTVCNDETASQNIAKRAESEKVNYLILHPEDDPDDIPHEYEGMVIGYDLKSLTKTRSIAN